MRFSLLCMQLCVLVFFSACGKLEEKFGRERGGYSKLEISLPKSVSAGELANGVMVYVYNVAEDGFSTTIKFDSEDQAATKALTLPNGHYKVFAIGWLAGNIFGDSSNGPKCGTTPGDLPISLYGQSASVSLVMNAAGCQLGLSTGGLLYPPDDTQSYSNSVNVRSMQYNFCNDGNLTGSEPNMSCSNANAAVTGLNIRVVLLGFSRSGDSWAPLPDSEHIYGACSGDISSGVVSVSYIPPGNSAPGVKGLFSSRIDFFNSAANCTGAPLKSITFRDGLYGSGTPINALRIGRRATGTYNKLLLNVNGF